MGQFKENSLKQMVFSGTSSGIAKTVTCVEIMKRKHKTVHQLTKIGSKKIEEIWEPKLEGLDRLKVVRELQTIHILLSKDPLDENELGYQQGKNCTVLTKNTHKTGNSSSRSEKFTSRKFSLGSNRGNKRKQDM